MQDGLKHYLHYLVPKNNGFMTISEISAIEMAKGDGSFAGGNWMVPVAPNGEFFDSYQVDYVQIILFDAPPKMHTTTAVRIGSDVFELYITAPMKFRKISNGKKGKYIGNKYSHYDFHFDLVEVDFIFGVMDELFKRKQYMVVGCQPYYHYQLVERNDDPSVFEGIVNLSQSTHLSPINENLDKTIYIP